MYWPLYFTTITMPDHQIAITIILYILYYGRTIVLPLIYMPLSSILFLYVN